MNKEDLLHMEIVAKIQRDREYDKWMEEQEERRLQVERNQEAINKFAGLIKLKDLK